MGAGERASRMRHLSKGTRSRNQGTDTAQQRGEPHRYQPKQLARLRAARAQAQHALTEAQARLRQLASPGQAGAVRLQIEVVWLSLHLFFKARISFRAVGRVLRLLASDLGLTRAPCPQTVITWGSRLSLVRIECARGLRGLPLARAPGTNGLLWRIARSLGLGPGTICAVVALDAQH